MLSHCGEDDPFFDNTSEHTQVWMSNSDTILYQLQQFEILAGTL